MEFAEKTRVIVAGRSMPQCNRKNAQKTATSRVTTSVPAGFGRPETYPGGTTNSCNEAANRSCMASSRVYGSAHFPWWPVQW